MNLILAAIHVVLWGMFAVACVLAIRFGEG